MSGPRRRIVAASNGSLLLGVVLLVVGLATGRTGVWIVGVVFLVAAAGAAAGNRRQRRSRTRGR